MYETEIEKIEPIKDINAICMKIRNKNVHVYNRIILNNGKHK